MMKTVICEGTCRMKEKSMPSNKQFGFTAAVLLLLLLLSSFSVNAAQVWIVDSAGFIDFNNPTVPRVRNYGWLNYRTNEAGGTVNVELRHSGGDDAVTLRYETFAPNDSRASRWNSVLQRGSDYATPGSDYVYTSGSINLNNGNSGRIQIPIIDDTIAEFNEDILLRIWCDANSGDSPVLQSSQTYLNPFDPPNTLPHPPTGFNEVTSGTFGGNQTLNILTAVTILADDVPAGGNDSAYNDDWVSLRRPGANNNVLASTIDPNTENAILGGEFTGYNGIVRNHLVRVLANGQIDSSFMASPNVGANGFVSAVYVYPSGPNAGKIIAGGGFTSFNGQLRPRIVRLNVDGSVDSSFNPGGGANNSVRKIIVDASGKIVVVGGFTTFNGESRKGIARLNDDGTLDSTFNPQLGVDGVIYDVVEQADGTYVIGGEFVSYNGTPRNRIARLNSQGGLDLTFDPGLGFDNTVYDLLIEPSGEILAVGAFTSFRLTPFNRIVRMTSSGGIDTTFKVGFGPANGFNDIVYQVRRDGAGEYYVGGLFTSFNQTPRNKLARLNSDGTVDTGFMDTTFGEYAGPWKQVFSDVTDPRDPVGVRPDVDSAIGPFLDNTETFIRTINIGADGRLLIGGGFDSVGGGDEGQIMNNNAWPPPADSQGFNQRNPVTTIDTNPRSNWAKIETGSSDGAGLVEFNRELYSVDEFQTNFPSVFRLRRYDGPGNFYIGHFEVDLLLSDVTSTQNLDYTTTDMNIPYSWSTLGNWDGERRNAFSGTQSRTLSVLPLHDSLVEENEQFTLSITNPVVRLDYLPNTLFNNDNPSQDPNLFAPYLSGQNLTTTGGGIGFLSEMVVEIIDDDFDFGIVGLGQPSYEIDEDEGMLSIVVNRSRSQIGSVSIDYDVYASGGMGDTAVQASYTNPAGNFVRVAGTLTFFEGEQTKTIQVPILDDQVVAPALVTLRVELSNPVGGVELDGAKSVSPIQINDNDTFTNPVAGRKTTTFSPATGADSIVNTINFDSDSSTLTVQGYNEIPIEGSTVFNFTEDLVFNYGANGMITVTSDRNITVTIDEDDSMIVDVSLIGNTLLVQCNQTHNANDIVAAIDLFGGINNGLVSAAVSGTGLDTIPDGDTRSVTFTRASNNSIRFVSNEDASIRIENNGGPLSSSFGGGTLQIDIEDATTAADIIAEVNGGGAGITAFSANGDGDTSSLPFAFDRTQSISASENDIRIVANRNYDVVIENALIGRSVSILGNVLTIEVEPFDNINDVINRINTSRLPVFAMLQPGENGSGRISDLVDPRNEDDRIDGMPITKAENNDIIISSTVPGNRANGAMSMSDTGDSVPVVTYVGGNLTIGMNEDTTGQQIIDQINNSGFPFWAASANSDNGSGDYPVLIDVVSEGDSVAGTLDHLQRVVIGGEFVNIDQNARGKMAKIWQTGNIDTNFLNEVAGFNNNVNIAVIDRNPGVNINKIVVGGSFTNFNGAVLRGIVRLNPDGTRDTSFDPGSGVNGAIHAIAIDRQSRVYLGGDFTTVNGIGRSGLVRLLNSGAVDTSFEPGTGALGGAVYALEIDANGDLYVGGDFTGFDGLVRERFMLVKVFASDTGMDGSVDANFDQWNENIFPSLTGRVLAIECLGSSNLLVGGTFTQTAGAPGDYLLQLDDTGTLVPGFMPVLNGRVNDIIIDPWGPTGVSLIVGAFTEVNGVVRNRIARVLESNGSIDFSFNTGLGADDEILDADIHPTRPFIALAGHFQNFNGSSANYYTIINDGDNSVLPSEVTFLADEFSINEDFNNTPVFSFSGGDGTQKASVDVTPFGPDNDFTLRAKAVGPDLNGINVVFREDSGGSGRIVLFDPAIRSLLISIDSGVTTAANIKAALMTDPTTMDVFDVEALGADTGVVPLGAVLVAVRRDGDLASSLTITLDDSNTPGGTVKGLVKNTSDYMPFTMSQPMDAGVSVVYFEVPIFDKPDQLTSADLILDLSVMPVGPSINIDQVTYTIQNTDSIIGFEFDSYSASEESANAVVRVFRDGDRLNTATVNFSTILGGTAVPGFDYIDVNGTLVFNPGEVYKTFPVPILDDATIGELNETIIVELSNESGADFSSEVGPGGNLVYPTQASISIVDNDFFGGFLSFTLDSINLDETSGNVTFDVIRTNGNHAAASVLVETYVGSSTNEATANADYAAISEVLTWGDGVTSRRTVTVPLLDDGLVEGQEVINVRLANPTGVALLGTITNILITVRDDESRIVVAPESVNVSTNEDSATAEVILRREGGSRGIVSVDVETFSLARSANSAIADVVSEGTPIDLELGDLDKDGFSDIAVLNQTSATIDIYKGFNNSTFVPFSSSEIGAAGVVPHRMILGDLNGDTDPDVVITKSNPVGLSVLIGQGNGRFDTFQNNDMAVIEIFDVDLGLVNGDSFEDLVVARTGGIDVLLGIGDGTFGSAISITLADAYRVRLVQLNQGADPGDDSFLDLVAVTKDAGGASELLVYSGDGSGAFTMEGASVSIPQADGLSEFRFADITANGESDIVTVNTISEDLSILIRSSDFAFAFNESLALDNGTMPLDILTSDFDGRFGDDVVVITATDQILSIPNNGQQSLDLTETVTYFTGKGRLEPTVNSNPSALAIGQVDGDGLPDFVVANSTTMTLGVFTGFGDGRFDGEIDYAKKKQTITWNDLDTEDKSFTVLLKDDLDFENNQDFQVRIANPTGNSIIGTSISTVTILENETDPGQFEFLSASQNISEEIGSLEVRVERVVGTSGRITVRYRTVDGTALAGEDYTETSGLLVFENNDDSESFLIPILSDTLGEPTEQFTIQLSNPTGGGSLSSSNFVQTVVITDNDVSIELESVNSSGFEGQPNAEIFVLRSGQTNDPVAVRYETVDSNMALVTATAVSGVDYQYDSNVLTFAAGETRKAIHIGLNDDTLVEGVEQFGINLTGIFGTGATLGSVTEGAVTITDDDTNIGAEFGTYTVSEGTTFVSIQVTREGDTTQTSSVSYATSSLTAQGGVDYVTSRGTIEFVPGDTTESINIQLIEDTLVEGLVSSEQFTLRLFDPVGAVLKTQTPVIINIQDNDSAIAFADATASVEEGGVINVTLNRVGDISKVSMVSVSSSDGAGVSGATAGEDYMPVNTVVTFGNGVSAQTVQIQGLADAMGQEELRDETFNLTLSNPTAATLGETSTMTVTVEDQGSPVYFASDSYTVDEDAGLVTLTIKRNNTGQAIDVTYSTVDPSSGDVALPSSDYVGVSSGMVSFGAAEDSKDITISIFDDSDAENGESFAVQIESVTVPGFVSTPSTASVLINDNESNIEFASSTYTVREGVAVVTLNVVRSGDLTEVASANFSTTDVSAAAGEDYDGTGGSVTFGVGETAKEISITIHDDQLVESSETFTVELAAATSNVVIGTESSSSISITDNDTITFEMVSHSIVSESLTPSNSRIDPGETVTVRFQLQNKGTVPTSDLGVSLVEENGVTSVTTAQTFLGVVQGQNDPDNSIVSVDFSFTVGEVAFVSAQLDLVNKVGMVENVLSSVVFDISVGDMMTFRSREFIKIPGTLVVPAEGPANPFPSSITVSNLTGLVSQVNVSLYGLSHTHPDDIDLLLVGPTGKKVLLMSDVGGSSDAVDIDVEFTDLASSGLPDGNGIASGSFKPTNVTAGDTFDGLIPGPYVTNLTTFNGVDPNGTWRLYAFDDSGHDEGAISRGWSLTVGTTVATSTDIALDGSAPMEVSISQPYTYTFTVTNNSVNAASSVNVEHTLPAGITIGAVDNSYGSVTTNSPTTVSVSLGTIEALTSKGYSLSVQAGQNVGTVSLVSTATTSTLESLTSNNSLSVDVDIQGAGMMALPPAMLDSGEFGLMLFGKTGVEYVIETSVDLINWIPVSTNRNNNGIIEFIETVNEQDGRFYRAVER